MRFIHMADVHLGAVPDKGHSWSKRRGEEIWRTFRKVLEEAREGRVDLLLIAGDLFHQPPTVRELREVNYLFGKLKPTRVVLIAGNHDFIGADSPVQDFEWESNVVCLDREYCQYVCFEEIDTYVYGFSYHQRELTEPLYDGLMPEKREGCHILLAHGGDESHVPINRKKLMNSGFDYIALGHIHRPKELKENKMAYAGALEPIDANDVGPHGYIRGEYKNGKIRTEFVEAAAASYVHLELESSSGTTSFSMQEQIQNAIAENGNENIYRIRLTGYRCREVRWDIQGWFTLGNILDITDDTRPDFDLQEIYENHREDVIGRYMEKLLFRGKRIPEEYFRSEEAFLPEKEALPEDNRKRELCMQAVYYGLHALLKEI